MQRKKKIKKFLLVTLVSLLVIIVTPIVLVIGACVAFELKIAMIRNRLIDLPAERYEAIIRKTQDLLESGQVPTHDPFARPSDLVTEFPDLKPRALWHDGSSRKGIWFVLAKAVDRGADVRVYTHEGQWIVDGHFGGNCTIDQLWPRSPDVVLKKSLFVGC